MLKLKKSADNQVGKWFTFSEGVELKIRPLNGDALKTIRKDATTVRMEMDSRSRKMTPVDDVDSEKLEAGIEAYILEDWKGIGDESGAPLEVNTENKRLILNQIALRDFCWSAAQALDIDIERD